VWSRSGKRISAKYAQSKASNLSTSRSFVQSVRKKKGVSNASREATKQMQSRTRNGYAINVILLLLFQRYRDSSPSFDKEVQRKKKLRNSKLYLNLIERQK
jgi:hypothetical protein